jgi:sec-independent protein translocase protein TatA
MGRGLFQPLHLLLILFIVLIIFGPGKLPELGEGLGKSIKAFKKALSSSKEEAGADAQREEK